MKHPLLIVAALLLAPVLAFGATAPSKPHVVYILADDLGYGDVHCLNPQRGKIATPNLDRLASQGMTFTDAHSGSSVCTPTRYGVLTGRYAWRTRAVFFLALKVVADGWRPCHKAGPGVQAKTNHPL